MTRTTGDTGSWSAHWPVVVVVVGCYVVFAVAAALSLGRLGELETRTVLDDVLFQSAFLGFPAVGGLLAVKRPGNRVGWLLLALGVLAPVSWLTNLLIERSLAGGGVGTALGIAASVNNALTPLALFIFLAFLLYFPDTAPRGWQLLMVRVAAAVTALMVLIRLLRPGPLDLGYGVEFANPLAIDSLAPMRDATDPLSTLVVLALLVAVVVVVVRFARADGIRRLQYKWVVAALTAAVALQLVTQFLPEGPGITIEDFASVVAIDIGLLGLCAAIAIAITRHRLFDLDRVISRTMAWTVVTVLAVGIYASAVLALGAAVRGLGGEGGNDLVVATSTLLTAVSVRPLLRRTRTLIDRRFDRAHYDAVLAIEALSSRLRHQVEVDNVVDELADTARTTLQPTSAWIWLPRPESA